jgi:hypothetical protein
MIKRLIEQQELKGTFYIIKNILMIINSLTKAKINGKENLIHIQIMSFRNTKRRERKN